MLSAATAATKYTSRGETYWKLSTSQPERAVKYFELLKLGNFSKIFNYFLFYKVFT